MEGLITGIRREAARLCGIRQEPLERWMKSKDAEGHNVPVPELMINLLLMKQAFLQLLATGLEALVLVSASAIVLSGFSNKIKKEDFWYITAIGILQTAKVVGSVSGPTARFFVQFPTARRGHVGDVRPKGYAGHKRSTSNPDPLEVERPNRLHREKIGLLPYLFAAAPIFAALACYVLSAHGLSGAIIKHYGRSDTDPKRGNVQPALIVFYSLVLTQVIVLVLWCRASNRRADLTQEFISDYFEKGNTNGQELVNRYITQTQDKCIEKGVFGTTNRTLVSFAAELLQSEYHSDHVSAVAVLHVLTTMEKRKDGAVQQISSSEQIVGSLFKLLRPKSPLDLETKVDTAEILTKLASNLRLTDIPGAVHSISSLLDPHPRSMKTAANAGHPEPPAPREPSPQGEIQTQTNNTNQGRAEPQPIVETHINIANSDASGSDSGAEPSSAQEKNQTTNTNEGGARDKPLIVHGLMILDKLASDPGNCTEICKTTDLVPKILAPLTHGLLKVTGNNDPKTIQIVKACLRVVVKITSGTCESSSKLRRELISGNGRTARNIMWIMRNSNDEQEIRMLAVEIVTRLTLGQPTNAVAVDLRSWEVIWGQVGDQFPTLVAIMNADKNSMEHRAVAAEFLAQICAKSKTDEDKMNRLSSVSNSLSEVLEAIVTTEITDMATEKRRFLASFLVLAVQIRENDLVTAPAFADAVRGLSMGIFCRFAKKLKEIIVKMTEEKESGDVIYCLVITKAAAKLVTWTMSINPVRALYFQQQNIADKLQNIVNAMGELERCVVLSGHADEMEPTYEMLQTLVEALRSRLVAVLGNTGQAARSGHRRSESN